MPIKKELLYPVFLECCSLCENNFWINIFEDLAYGKCPSGTYINKDFLTCSYKGKEFQYKIERKDPAILYKDIFTLLTERLNIFSNKEKSQKKIIFNEVENNIKNSYLNWSCIKKKTVKDSIYEKYAINMKKKHNLSIKQTKYLLSLIFLAITFKTLTHKNIVYEDEEITSINCISFENGKVILTKPLCSSSGSGIYENETEINLISENWEKYLKTLEK